MAVIFDERAPSPRARARHRFQRTGAPQHPGRCESCRLDEQLLTELADRDDTSFAPIALCPPCREDAL